MAGIISPETFKWQYRTLRYTDHTRRAPNLTDVRPTRKPQCRHSRRSFCHPTSGRAVRSVKLLSRCPAARAINRQTSPATRRTVIRDQTWQVNRGRALLRRAGVRLGRSVGTPTVVDVARSGRRSIRHHLKRHRPHGTAQSAIYPAVEQGNFAMYVPRQNAWLPNILSACSRSTELNATESFPRTNAKKDFSKTANIAASRQWENPVAPEFRRNESTQMRREELQPMRARDERVKRVRLVTLLSQMTLNGCGNVTAGG